MRTFSFSFEIPLMEAMQSVMNPIFVRLASAFSFLGEELILVVAAGFFFWCWDKKTGRRIGTVIILSALFSPMVKNLVLRNRPYLADSRVKCLRAPYASEDPYNIVLQGYSFPSLHASNAMTLFGSVSYVLRKKIVTVLSAVIILGVGLSRVLLGCHYPTDVLGGYLFGLLSMLVYFGLEDRVRHPWLFQVLPLILAIPGWFFCHSTDFYTAYGLLLGFFFADWFEKKCVNFEETHRPLFIILRIAGGVAVFFLLSTLLKLPFRKEFLEADAFLPYLVRAVRYAILVFVDLGLYPMLFSKVEKHLQA